MKNREKSIFNFMYFLSNYKNDWVRECFKDEPIHSQNHLESKWKDYIFKYPSNTAFHFFFSLSRHFQLTMIQYVEGNYLGFEEFQIEQP